MTDIELLKLAAKAAGIQYEWHPGCGDALCLTAPDATALFWNPLANCEDAFKLMVQLGISLTIETIPHAVYVNAYTCNCSAREVLSDIRLSEPIGSNLATRRAITRCAAEIGKLM